jgi:hypothetical protein
MNTPRKVVLVTTVFGVALTGALAKSAYGLASSSDARNLPLPKCLWQVLTVLQMYPTAT